MDFPEFSQNTGHKSNPIVTYHLSQGCHRTVIDLPKPARHTVDCEIESRVFQGMPCPSAVTNASSLRRITYLSDNHSATSLMRSEGCIIRSKPGVENEGTELDIRKTDFDALRSSNHSASNSTPKVKVEASKFSLQLLDCLHKQTNKTHNGKYQFSVTQRPESMPNLAIHERQSHEKVLVDAAKAWRANQSLNTWPTLGVSVFATNGLRTNQYLNTWPTLYYDTEFQARFNNVFTALPVSFSESLCPDKLSSSSKWWDASLREQEGGLSKDSGHYQDSVSKASTSDLSKPMSKFWTLLDIAACYFWIGPLVLIFWNNTWTLCDHYIFKGNAFLSAWVSAVFGYTTFIIASLLQNHLLLFSTNRSRSVRFVMTRLYTYIMTLGCVNQWRGLWQLLDQYMGVSFINATATYAFASFVLLLLRCYKATHGPPAIVVTDFPHAVHYQMTTFFSATTNRLSIFLDSIFTILVIESLGISIWRGFWEMLDMKLCPDVQHMSAIWSLVLSYGLACVLLVLQYPSMRVSACLEALHWLAKLVFEDIIAVLYTVVSITHWRGLWLLSDLYMPYRPHSLWVAHFLSFVLLTLGMAANSILVRGCPRDGDLSDGQGVVCETAYVSKLLKARERKLNR